MACDRPLIVVVGGANLDIAGIPTGGYIPRDSNVGHVRTSSGGVGRNIAENLARLGAGVRLVTAFGDDADSAHLRAACEEVGMDCTYSVLAGDVPCSRYLAVLDAGGDLAAAVNDMRALAELVPERLDPTAFDGARAVVIDTNLPAATIIRVAELAGGAPLVLDPVSVVKAEVARPILGRLAALKANLMEAEALSGAVGAEHAAARLLELGAQRVFVTLGPEGVLCTSATESFVISSRSRAVRNASGAGDAFTAGVAWGLACGLPLRDTAEMAVTLSAIALESENTVNDQLSATMLAERMEVPQR
ncbi:MAG: carbohydrate kinase family protein [Coriobacteriia bacterium]|nr:carbohydrate kinase family protein [Coriobacteriia bacterium]